MDKAADSFQGWTCQAPDDRIERMTGVILKSVAPESVRRVLDLGCGAGAQMRRLAPHFPHATLTGVDISTENIRLAMAARDRDPAAERLQFVCSDYMAFRDAPFDLIVSDGVVHFVDADQPALTAKLSRDLTPGGRAVIAMATDCLYNRVSALARGFLRAARSRPVDALILALGRALHGTAMSDAMLAERIPYMYMPPRRLLGRRFMRDLESCGLQLTATYPMPSTSAMQLRHAVAVFQQVSGTAGASTR